MCLLSLEGFSYVKLDHHSSKNLPASLCASFLQPELHVFDVCSLINHEFGGAWEVMNYRIRQENFMGTCTLAIASKLAPPDLAMHLPLSHMQYNH